MQQSNLFSFSPNAENTISGAPYVDLENGERVIPQHFKTYHHALASIESLLVDIECEPDILLFAGRSQGALYLQAGIIGRENYPIASCEGAQSSGQTCLRTSSKTLESTPPKLVYGRKWMISSDTPTAEVIQTAFLAIKKLKEHEVREWFSLYEPESKRFSRVFSTHQDLSLMEANRELFESQAIAENQGRDDIERLIARSKFQGRAFKINHLSSTHSGGYLLELELEESETQKTSEANGDFDRYRCGIVLESLHPTLCLHRMMDELIAHSDRLVAERFRYRGFARFSRQIDPSAIARLSIATRGNGIPSASTHFESTFKQTNFDIDATRVPEFGHGELARKNLAIIRNIERLTGHMPAGFLQAETDHVDAVVEKQHATG